MTRRTRSPSCSGCSSPHRLHVSSASPRHVLALLRFKSHKLGGGGGDKNQCLCRLSKPVHHFCAGAKGVWTEPLLHEVGAHQDSRRTAPNLGHAGRAL